MADKAKQAKSRAATTDKSKYRYYHFAYDILVLALRHGMKPSKLKVVFKAALNGEPFPAMALDDMAPEGDNDTGSGREVPTMMDYLPFNPDPQKLPPVTVPRSLKQLSDDVVTSPAKVIKRKMKNGDVVYTTQCLPAAHKKLATARKDYGVLWRREAYKIWASVREMVSTTSRQVISAGQEPVSVLDNMCSSGLYAGSMFYRGSLANQRKAQCSSRLRSCPRRREHHGGRDRTTSPSAVQAFSPSSIAKSFSVMHNGPRQSGHTM
ncbi:hypothetical protein CONLIGDRAFT_693868 [Coniochaeta ligniaria NRRL 30616]|uniref:Uncharacterized protein n=1 Tax=Coniochaeta ligniaria NRRL 30616 TaxID=1408157 RepID=A0A1J7J071_9PEZI|nr:hypothetical protein CONLIGDRAFT_693868 [Coniochaeta ligniaria NRRL 30616]